MGGLINLARIVTSPRLSQTITIERSTGAFVNGVFTDKKTEYESYGVFAPADDFTLGMFPEGDRRKGVMVYITVDDLYVTRSGKDAGVSDLIVWNNQRFRVVALAPWVDYGFNLAMAERLPL